ncbi:hypothetical protein [Brevundimonas sp.]|uniref:hypothetical protein n=1 Tax=Brevundimonas sp. TaxID=1871086 RepID=UPI0028A11EBB|nr:hypothetical protein [Brevundimonas sp.]
MARGGKREGAGRKPGSGNKKTWQTAKENLLTVRSTNSNLLVPIIEPVIAALSPLEVMGLAMASAAQAGDWDAAQKYARDLAPYTHPKLANITVKTDSDIEARELTDEEIDARLRELARLTAIDADIIEPDAEAGT